MQGGYYASAAGMVTQFNRLDIIANNLANVNTTAFKQDDVVIGDFMRLYKDARDELPNQDNTKDAAKFLNRTVSRVPRIDEEYTNYSLGNLDKSTNSLDFALSREGLFFAVKTPQGVRLTRDGSFTLNDDGKLVTKQGYEVLQDDYFKTNNTIEFNVEENIIHTDKNGQFYTNLPNSSKMSIGAKLFIAQPTNMKELQKEGDNLYVYKDIDKLAPLQESDAVLQGFLEKSNVNAVKMMTQLIETNRLVGMYQKAMDTQMNDMNRDAIEKIAKKS